MERYSRRKTYGRRTKTGYRTYGRQRGKMIMYRGLRNFQPNGIIKKKVSATCTIKFGDLDDGKMAYVVGNYGSTGSLIPAGTKYVLFGTIIGLNPDYLRMAQTYCHYRITGAKATFSPINNTQGNGAAFPYLPVLYCVVRIDANAGSPDLGPAEVTNTDSVLVCPPAMNQIRSKYWRFPKSMSGYRQSTVGWNNTADGTETAYGSFDFSSYQRIDVAALPTVPPHVYEAKFTLYVEFWTENGGAPV